MGDETRADGANPGRREEGMPRMKIRGGIQRQSGGDMPQTKDTQMAARQAHKQ